MLVGQPFDITKTRMQTAAPGQYKGALDVVRQTIARDGVKGYRFSIVSLFSERLREYEALMMTSTDRFYRGMGPPIMGVAPMFAVSFWVRFTCRPRFFSLGMSTRVTKPRGGRAKMLTMLKRCRDTPWERRLFML